MQDYVPSFPGLPQGVLNEAAFMPGGPGRMTSTWRRRRFRWYSTLGAALIWCIVSTVGSCANPAPPGAWRARAHVGGNHEAAIAVGSAFRNVDENWRSTCTREAASLAASVGERHRAANEALQRGIELQNVRRESQTTAVSKCNRSFDCPDVSLVCSMMHQKTPLQPYQKSTITPSHTPWRNLQHWQRVEGGSVNHSVVSFFSCLV